MDRGLNASPGMNKQEESLACEVKLAMKENNAMYNLLPLVLQFISEK